MLRNDPATKEIMKTYKDRYIISDRSRHLHESAGPRYKLFGPGSLIPWCRNRIKKNTYSYFFGQIATNFLYYDKTYNAHMANMDLK